MYVFRAQLAVALPCVLIACGFLYILSFLALRTRIIHLRFLNTKEFFHKYQPPLLNGLYRHIMEVMEPETP